MMVIVKIINNNNNNTFQIRGILLQERQPELTIQ